MSRRFLALRAAFADRYTLERKLGTGGMASVYLAHDIRLFPDIGGCYLIPGYDVAPDGRHFMIVRNPGGACHLTVTLNLLDNRGLGGADAASVTRMSLMPRRAGGEFNARRNRSARTVNSTTAANTAVKRVSADASPVLPS